MNSLRAHRSCTAMKTTAPHAGLLLIILAGFLWTGCGDDATDIVGPVLLVEPLSASQATVAFADEQTVYFTARFNQSVNWLLVITGQDNGATKVISGSSRELGPGNARWDGSTTLLPFFMAGMCDIQLILADEDSPVDTTEVEVVSGRVYSGTAIADFEGDPGADIFYGNFEFELARNAGIRSDGKAVHESKFLYLEGTDNVVPNFFVGLVNILAGITGGTYFDVPTTVPEDLYFNAFLWHDARPHTIGVIQFVYDSNSSGAFEDGQDQLFQFAGDYPLDHFGWRQVSHSMAELGMTAEQVARIVAIRILLISDMNTQPNPPLPVAYGVDFMSFTEGAPLQP